MWLGIEWLSWRNEEENVIGKTDLYRRIMLQQRVCRMYIRYAYIALCGGEVNKTDFVS